MWEGVEHKWIDEIPEWFTCPEVALAPKNAPRASFKETLLSAFQDPLSLPTKLVDLVTAPRPGVEIRPDGAIVCPYAWSTPLHELNCQYIWPAVLNVTEAASPRRPHPPSRFPKLDTPEYLAALDKDLVMEKLLAQGGLRLAAVLNWLFAQV